MKDKSKHEHHRMDSFTQIKQHAQSQFIYLARAFSLSHPTQICIGDGEDGRRWGSTAPRVVPRCGVRRAKAPGLVLLLCRRPAEPRPPSHPFIHLVGPRAASHGVFPGTGRSGWGAAGTKLPPNSPSISSFHSSPTSSRLAGIGGLIDPHCILSPARISPINLDDSMSPLPLPLPPPPVMPTAETVVVLAETAAVVAPLVVASKEADSAGDKALDLRLFLRGRDGRCVVMELDFGVLCDNSTFFAASVVRRRPPPLGQIWERREEGMGRQGWRRRFLPLTSPSRRTRSPPLVTAAVAGGGVEREEERNEEGMWREEELI
uniref:Uncharacterized protein n=1 Tax=Oryza glumipatula TaxID=40148 RepID=A0A0E0A805_9ORYZ